MQKQECGITQSVIRALTIKTKKNRKTYISSCSSKRDFLGNLVLDDFERLNANNAGNGSAAKAGGANLNGFVSAVFSGNTNGLQIGLEQTAGNAGAFRTNAA